MFLSPLAFNIACVPLIVATALAYAVNKEVLLGPFLAQAAAGVLVIVWLNLTNDVFDAETGVDVEKRESVVNRTGEREALFWAANASLALGIAIFVGVILQTRQSTAGLMLLASVCIGYVYQGPPFRLSYLGVGEILCFFAFGPLATSAFFLTQSARSFGFASMAQIAAGAPLVAWAATLLGLTTANILLNSHYHQVETDGREGKMSPAVRLGTKVVSRLSCALVAACYGIYTACLARGTMPWSTLFFVPFSLPSALRLARFVLANHADKAAVKPAKFLAVKWHRNFALLLSLGLLCSHGNAAIPIRLF